MTKKIIFTLLGVLVMIGILGGIKGLQINRMIAIGSQSTPPPETVTTAVVRSESWEALITSVGSLEAVQGVKLTAELPGKVKDLHRQPRRNTASDISERRLCLERTRSSVEGLHIEHARENRHRVGCHVRRIGWVCVDCR